MGQSGTTSQLMARAAAFSLMLSIAPGGTVATDQAEEVVDGLLEVGYRVQVVERPIAQPELATGGS